MTTGRETPTPVRSRTAAGIGYTVYGAGPQVVLLAPAATRADIWQTHQVPALLALGRSVVAVETRGGAGSVAQPGPYPLLRLVADAAEVVEALDAGPLPVVGASLGAMVAQELALARPDLVDRIALLGTRLSTDAYRSASARVLADRMRGAPPSRAEAEFEAVALIGLLFSPRTLDDDAAVTDWLSLFTAFPLRGAGLAAQYETAADYGLDDRSAALADLRVPCLVVSFAEDRVTPPAQGRLVAAAVPGARLVEIPGCGHFGFLERPDLVNAALAGFLR